METWGPFLESPDAFRVIFYLQNESARKRLEARNFAVISIFISFTIYEKTSFTELVDRSFTNGFSGLSRNEPLARDTLSTTSYF